MFRFLSHLSIRRLERLEHRLRPPQHRAAELGTAALQAHQMSGQEGRGQQVKPGEAQVFFKDRNYEWIMNGIIIGIINFTIGKISL